MPAVYASAPGKIILFGEHAVVYGRPAIAVPVTQVKAKAAVQADVRAAPGTVRIHAAEIGLDTHLEDLSAKNPLAAAIHLVLQALKVSRLPACTIRIHSTIPVASGLGSGAAVSVALLRAVSGFLGRPLPDDRVCALAFEIEKIHHGTPSGIDNTVITYAQPVYFVKDEPIQILRVARPFTIVIGDTGVSSPTSVSVGDVRKAWQAKREHYESLFDSAAGIADAARVSIETGMPENLGMLMNANHGILKRMGVSSPELDRLVQAAQAAGAWGAKLSGGGRGGNMIALVDSKQAGRVAAALESAGAVRTIITEVAAS